VATVYSVIFCPVLCLVTGSRRCSLTEQLSELANHQNEIKKPSPATDQLIIRPGLLVLG